MFAWTLRVALFNTYKFIIAFAGRGYHVVCCCLFDSCINSRDFLQLFHNTGTAHGRIAQSVSVFAHCCDCHRVVHLFPGVILSVLIPMINGAQAPRDAYGTDSDHGFWPERVKLYDLT